MKPKFGCATKFIYSKVKRFKKPKLDKPSKKMFDLNYLRKMSNDLESIAFNKYPMLKKIKLFLDNLSRHYLLE